MSRFLAVLAALGLLVALPGATARAEHEVFLRYTVVGYVKDADGAPRAAAPVKLIRDKTGFSYLTDTDERGFFVVVARLGDGGVGESLTLQIGSVSMRITARFDPANHTDERGTRVDLEGARFVERAAWFRSTLAHFLGPTPR